MIYGGVVKEEDAIKFDVGTNNFANIVKSLVGLTTKDTLSSKLTLSMLKDLEINAKFVVTREDKLMDNIQGTVDYDTDEEGNRFRTVTYTLKFDIDNFNVETLLGKINSTNYSTIKYEKAKEATTTTPATPNTLTYTFKNVETAIKDVTGYYASLAGYAKLFNLSIDGNEISLASEAEFKSSLISALGVEETDTLESLNNKSYKAHITLTEGVNKEDETRSIDFDLVFKVVVSNLSGTDKLSDKLNSSSVVVLESNKTYEESNLKITATDVVIRGNGSTIKGDIQVSGNSSIKLEDVTVKGKITVDSGKSVNIKGDGATIEGAITVSGDKSSNKANVSIDNVTIIGTNEAMTFGSGTPAVISAANTSGTLTLTNSNVSYKGGKSIPNDGSGYDYVYSLVYVDGNATITGNTFDITNVKNPIEYKWAENDATNVNISNNKFTGNNYVSNDAHNVISFYGFGKDATFKVTDNTFEYANWAIRISEGANTDNKAIFIVTGNKVESNKFEYKDEVRPAALIGVQYVNNEDLSNITIKYANNTLTNGEYLTEKVYTEKANLENKSVLVNAFKKNGIVSEDAKLPNIERYVSTEN